VSEYISRGTVGPKLEEFRQPSGFPADSITVRRSKGLQSASQRAYSSGIPDGSAAGWIFCNDSVGRGEGGVEYF
jgi:hypothetical protein